MFSFFFFFLNKETGEFLGGEKKGAGSSALNLHPFMVGIEKLLLKPSSRATPLIIRKMKSCPITVPVCRSPECMLVALIMQL